MYVVANWSAGHTIEFKNIGKNVVVALKSESGPTALVATVLQMCLEILLKSYGSYQLPMRGLCLLWFCHTEKGRE